MTSVKMPFAINKNNKLVHIVDVERGKKCNCVCLDCKFPLIASKGPKQQYHFKHEVESECKGESVVHLAAKQIIKERKQIILSSYIATVSKRDSTGKEHAEQKIVVENGRVISFDCVQEEIELHGMKADVLAKKDNTLLIIEIFYRHKVDDQKHLKIREANISAIEIKLSDLTPEDVKDRETFWLCINDPQRVRWLHNAKAGGHYQALRDRLAIKIQEQEEKYKQEEIEKQEQKKQELGCTLNNSKRLQRKEFSEPHNHPHASSRPFKQRSPLPIDRVGSSNGKFKGTQKSSSSQRGQTSGRKKGRL